jgi:chloramphenicol-sensitive protein RarD
MNRGVLYAVGAYLLWGLLPIYWEALQAVPAIQILSHRFVWSFVFLISLILIKREWDTFKRVFTSRTTVLIYTAAACLLAVNWLTYIWGVNAGFVVETSLGYFINPLVSVLLGVIFLKEKLRPFQWMIVSLAGLGVLYLTFSYGGVPWIALILAFSFGVYGLVKKTAPLGSLHGLGLETTILLLPTTLFLLYEQIQGVGAFGNVNTMTTVLLAFTGVVTAFPLLLFASAARIINLSTLGILQYIAPTCQFLLGVMVYHETFTFTRLVGFAIIWSALILFTFEGISVRRRAELSASVGD